MKTGTDYRIAKHQEMKPAVWSVQKRNWERDEKGLVYMSYWKTVEGGLTRAEAERLKIELQRH